jgi:hypothetical protein
MAYRIQVAKNTETGAVEYTSLPWANLISHLIVRPTKSLASLIDDELFKYNGRNLLGTYYIEFDTEADAIMFILAWS